MIWSGAGLWGVWVGHGEAAREVSADSLAMETFSVLSCGHLGPVYWPLALPTVAGLVWVTRLRVIHTKGESRPAFHCSAYGIRLPLALRDQAAEGGQRERRMRKSWSRARLRAWAAWRSEAA